MDKQVEFTELTITLAEMNISGMKRTVTAAIFIRDITM